MVDCAKADEEANTHVNNSTQWRSLECMGIFSVAQTSVRVLPAATQIKVCAAFACLRSKLTEKTVSGVETKTEILGNRVANVRKRCARTQIYTGLHLLSVND